jgi:cytochrome c oxidase subunit III
MSDVALMPEEKLLVGSIGYRSSGWWAMLAGILSEAALFVFLLFTYSYLAVQPHSGAWPPGGNPSFKFALPETIAMLLGCVAVWWGEWGTKRDNRPVQIIGLACTLALGIAFVVLQYFEWMGKSFSVTTDSYGSVYFIVTGFDMAHVVVGILVLASVLVWSAIGYFGPVRHAYVSIGAIYWYFVAVVWLVLFFTFYITPYLS